MATALPTPTSTKRANNTVANLLREKIESGYYAPGDWLPTERSLAQDLGVDRRVVRAAINDLVRDGLVEHRPHCRPIIRRKTEEVSPLEATESAAHPTSEFFSDSPSSGFVALIMFPGGPLEQHRTSQQRIFWGMNQALAEAGYHAVFLSTGQFGSEEENAANEAMQLRYVLERGFGGVVLYPYAYHRNQALVEEVRRRVPVVTIDRRLTGLETDFVGINNRQAVFDMTMHLAAQGHRRIAYVTKCEQLRSVQDRTQGYMDAAREADIPETILTIPSRDRDTPWTVTDAVFRLPVGERSTAAVVFNDYTALDLMHRLEHLGLSVPQDVALAGFDNIISLLPNGVGLTTVAQPYEEIGRTAVDLLLRRRKAPSAPVATVELPTQLILRDSTPPYK